MASKQDYEVYNVRIPPTIGPGEMFTVDHLGQRFNVTAPDIPPPDGMMLIRLPTSAALQQQVPQQQMPQQQMPQHPQHQQIALQQQLQRQQQLQYEQQLQMQQAQQLQVLRQQQAMQQALAIQQ